MTPRGLPLHRLHSQRLAASDFTDPADVVRWFGAVQAQDYLGALWAVGLRMRFATEAAVERAVADRRIVRTWPMRGTLHFVAAEDVRWMLALLTPRVVAASAARLRREFGLDARVLGRCADAATRALEGGRCLTRAGLYGTLDRARIKTAGGRGLQIVSALAHQGVICYGPRDGKHHTVVLLDEWLPPATAMDREEALAELARRYFTSHGPATVSDFAWWSGLLVRDAQRGLDAASRSLVAVEREGRAWWAAPGSARGGPARAYLLPAFDEYTVAYKDRSDLVAPAHAHEAAGMGLLRPAIVVNGRVEGYWNRTVVDDRVSLALNPYGRLGPAAQRAVAAAGRRYAGFLERSADAA